ncbi:hypothetical protein [Actinotalea fermentans]|uniref:Glycosyl transferase n=1 Tax=Actinotalea fermentans TaxID=43671 RepID=A0A511YXD3_9CELL|nr:hypothetical protein [Actinotalea fermentans]KGM16788.1 hypothetical protein N867_15740 [Actinotalea fermentans ATCC 43279 = JCM 9966 = DSM 3133]GEN79796.1 glycosyl transferase [Actinotalea fermentans]
MDDPRYEHVACLTTAVGLYEHALFAAPRVEHGMCVDDASRALLVTAREPRPTPDVVSMSRIYLAYLLRAQAADGRMHNRSDDTGRWLDAPATGDHWGRALWAFGTAAAHSPEGQVRAGGVLGAQRALLARSPYPRAMAYAALGAAALMRTAPENLAARRLLHDARSVLSQAESGAGWLWPDHRLTYANAVLPEAMITVGRALHDDELRDRGLALLGWLADHQDVAGHVSVVPAGGRGPGERRPSFDQQPIEVASMAEAAATAFGATGDHRWAALVARCEAWFEGDNDGRLRMRAPSGGGAYDGLEDGSVNLNQGAESTLASVATAQLVDLLADVLSPVAP